MQPSIIRVSSDEVRVAKPRQCLYRPRNKGKEAEKKSVLKKKSL